MRIESNKFGEGVLNEAHDLCGKVYFSCCACMSIYSEALSWANANQDRISLPVIADSIVVLSCQVTDLAIYNDIKRLECLMESYPGRKYFIGGCLARRFDIELPEGVERLDHVRSDYTEINYTSLAHFEKPFWVPYFERGSPLSPGNLFRQMYPLRVSVGCKKNCTYCTIKTTRGCGYDLDIDRFKHEFSRNNNVVIIADSPSVDILTPIMEYALDKRITISLRNVEPPTALKIMGHLHALADKKLLNVLHSPIQSDNPDVLKDMGRDSGATLELISKLPELEIKCVSLATNIITDYKDYPNPDADILYKTFHYISYNPYWNGVWDWETAKNKFEKYFGTWYKQD